MNSSTNDLQGNQNQENPNPEPAVIQPKQRERRTKWSSEDYRNVLRAFYIAQSNPMRNTTEQTYVEWRKLVGHNIRVYIDANKLANVRRDIIKNKRLNDAQIDIIRNEIRNIERNNAENENVENVVRVDPLVRLENLTTIEIQNRIAEVRRGHEIIPEREAAVREENVLRDVFIENNREKLLDAREDILRELAITAETDMEERNPLPKLTLSSKTNSAIKLYNVALSEIVRDTDQDLTSLNNIVYATAKAITNKLGVKTRKSKKKHINKEPKWKVKLKKEIESLRAEISILDEISKGTIVKSRKSRRVKKKYNIIDKVSLDTAKEVLKQKIQVKAQRLRRFDKRTKFYRQNKIFKTDAKKFYREIGKSKIEVKEPPKNEEVEEFWNDIWGKEKKFNEEASWIGREQERMNEIEEQQWEAISLEELRFALGKSHKWKSPGIDKIPNFWLNSLTEVHENLKNSFNKIITSVENVPDWLTEGITYLLPKSNDTRNPKNYRPITCLTTTYKILTSIITDRMYKFLDENSILPHEQKGCKRNSYGCKDQLLINKMILEDSKRKNKNLSTAWIDYRKAFDSVPHDWILKSLEMYKISPTITNFLKSSMSKWNTSLFLSHDAGITKSHPLKIKRGIFQGDSLSPLLFCISLIPLSNELNNAESGYKIYDQIINHLFYMDDLKLFAKNDEQLEGLLTTVKQFSNDICMDFGLDKCAKATFLRGRLAKTSSISLDPDTTIRELDPEEMYKYLGVNEGNGINHAAMKEKIRKEYYRRVRLVLKTELNSKNRIEAINTLAVPVVQYSYNIINWNPPDIQRMDIKTRKLFTSSNMLHPKADVDRLYLPRSKGGRGLIQLEMSYKTTTIGMKQYLELKDDWMLKLVSRHERNKKLHSIYKKSQKFEDEFNIEMNQQDEQQLTATKIAKKVKTTAKQRAQKQLADRWSQKPLHGQYVLRSQNADVDNDATHQWLRSSGLKAETEGFIIAAQDQSLFTRNYQANILKNGADPKCRFCDQHTETIDHLVSGCTVLAPTEYVRRHDRVGQYLHWGICNHFGIDTHPNWYEHHPLPVVEIDNITILWDFPVNTDRTIQANRPDIIIKDKKKKECILIDMSVPTDKNISVKVFDKLSKYKDLEIEIQKMWNLKTITVPVVIGALGMIRKGTQDFIDKVPGEHNLQQIQKIVLTSTAHILRKVLSI